MSFYTLLYQSRATVTVTPDLLADILDTARFYNRAHQVTGLMLYRDGCFVQLLEGARAGVEVLFEAICRDPRHGAITILSEGVYPRRHMPAWDMGFSSPGGSDLRLRQREDFIAVETARLQCETLPTPLRTALLPYFAD